MTNTADVKITNNHVLLNGEDITGQLTRTGVKVEFTEYGLALVTLTFKADVDLDLPQAQVVTR